MRNSHIRAASRDPAEPRTWHAKAGDGPPPSRWPHAPRRVRYKLAPCPEIDCIRHLLAPGTIAAAELRAIEIGTGADRVLVAQGAMSDEHYVRALAFSFGCGFDSLLTIPRSACPASDLELIEATKSGILWLAAGRRRLLVLAPQHLTARCFVNHIRFNPGLAADICFTTSQNLLSFVSRHAKDTVAGKAAFELAAEQPELSARSNRSRFSILPISGCLAMLAAIAFAPALTTVTIDIALALIFLGWTALRMMGALTAGLLWQRQVSIADSELPVYSLIVALYHEAASVQGLVESLQALDYPPEKLDIKFVLEADDHETRRALTALDLAAPFSVITAPEEGPRTKPKALNAALPFVRGSYVAVYDAEDRPDPDQLKKALQVFHAGHSKLACVQARLTIDNSCDSWLTSGIMAQTPQASECVPA